MGSGFVEIREIWAMLKECAPGFVPRRTDHYWRVIWRGKIYATLPLGAHSKRKGDGLGAEVKFGYVRTLVHALDIPQDCARKYFPSIS